MVADTIVLQGQLNHSPSLSVMAGNEEDTVVSAENCCQRVNLSHSLASREGTLLSYRSMHSDSLRKSGSRL